MPVNTHPFTNEDVMAYLDGELSPETAAAMTAHLAQCKACQDIAADLQSVSRHLSAWTLEPPGTLGIPDQISTALDSRAEEATKKHAHVRPWRFLQNYQWVVVAASVIFLIPVVFWISAARTASMQRKVAAPAYESLSAELAPSPSAQALPPASQPSPSAPEPRLEGPTLIVRTAELHLTARTFDTVRADLDRILAQFGGHIAQLNAASPTNEARTLAATLRLPAGQLQAALAQLRKLGRIDSESQHGEEVTQQSIDLEARLVNARHTEQRLTQILATRTGKLSDVLEVEEKLSQVRGLIEQAEAEQKSLNNRVSFATILLGVSEDYRVPLTGAATSSVGTRLSNAAVSGLQAAADGLIGFIQFLLTAGPSLLLVCLLLALPAYFFWKKHRNR